MGVSIGLVGLGQFGAAFAELFKNHPLVDRVALCDREPDRMEVYAGRESWRDKFNRNDMYESLDDICRSDLDALVIITQPWLHAPQCIQAMESGKSVYSAVPVISLPDGDEILEWCDRLVETCKRTGKRYMLGETTFYRPQAMYCRRRAAEGAFGAFVYSEGEYLHDYATPACDLRKVQKARLSSRSGREWEELGRRYAARGVKSGPMHYPTHSVSGPACVMNAHAVRVCAWGYGPHSGDAFFDDSIFSNETAMFTMSNGTTMRICEYREVGHPGREMFSVYGTEGSYEHGYWCDKSKRTGIKLEDMRNPLPHEVEQCFRKAYGDDDGTSDFVPKGHGGSHPYLVHEFVESVAEDRQPAINVWEAVRYMAAGVMAHKSALRDGEILDVPDWGDAQK